MSTLNVQCQTVISEFTKSEIKPVLKEKCDEYVPTITKNIMQIGEFAIKKAREAVVDSKKNSKECYSVCLNHIIRTTNAGMTTLQKVLNLHYQIILTSDHSERKVAPDFPCPEIFSQYLGNEYALTAKWTPQNPFIYKDLYSAVKHYKFDPKSELETLWQAAQKGNHTDVTFMVEKEPIHAHTTILKIKMAYFATMFQVDMQERRNGIVEIKEYSPSTFKAFLEFIYTGNLSKEKLSDIQLVVELLQIGHQYDNQQLIAFCTDLVNDWLEEYKVDKNFDTFFYLGTVYNVEDLLRHCIQFAENDPIGMAKLLSLVEAKNVKILIQVARRINCPAAIIKLTDKALELIG